jgi:hypothetical protein
LITLVIVKDKAPVFNPLFLPDRAEPPGDSIAESFPPKQNVLCESCDMESRSRRSRLGIDVLRL